MTQLVRCERMRLEGDMVGGGGWGGRALGWKRGGYVLDRHVGCAISEPRRPT